MYKYDTLNRLTSADRGDLDVAKTGLAAAAVKYQDWTLDKVGNWNLFWDDSATALTRSHSAANEITAIDSSSSNLGHDAAGNMTRAPYGGNYLSYEYDHLNRVTGVKDNGASDVAAYSYDAMGRRIEKIDKTGESDVTFTYYYTPGWQLLEVYKDGDADVYEQFVWGGLYIDEAIRRQRDTDTNGTFDDTLFYNQDGNWNVIAVLNADGTVQARYIYDAYGTPAVLEADWTSDTPDDKDNELRYCGYYWDAETANYHVRARYLSSTLGRWLSRDPLGYIDGTSLYEYVGSTPVNAVDTHGYVKINVGPVVTKNLGTIKGPEATYVVLGPKEFPLYQPMPQYDYLCPCPQIAFIKAVKTLSVEANVKTSATFTAKAQTYVDVKLATTEIGVDITISVEMNIGVTLTLFDKIVVPRPIVVICMTPDAGGKLNKASYAEQDKFKDKYKALGKDLGRYKDMMKKAKEYKEYLDKIKELLDTSKKAVAR